MIKTWGLTHIALKVTDLDRSSLFYQKLFGAREMYRESGFIQLQTPGSYDIIVLEKSKRFANRKSGIQHFGFRLKKRGDMQKLLNELGSAGAIIKESGEFVPGEPYVFFYDPDGYEIEIWFEKIPKQLSSFQ